MHPRTHSRANWQRPSSQLPCPALNTRPLVERIADAMITLCAAGNCTHDTLIEAGIEGQYTADDLVANISAARKIATAKYVRQSDAPKYNRPLRLAQLRLAIAEMLPGKQIIIAEMQGQRFTKAELDDLLPEAIALAADDFCAYSTATVQ